MAANVTHVRVTTEQYQPSTDPNTPGNEKVTRTFEAVIISRNATEESEELCGLVEMGQRIVKVEPLRVTCAPASFIIARDGEKATVIVRS